MVKYISIVSKEKETNRGLRTNCAITQTLPFSQNFAHPTQNDLYRSIDDKLTPSQNAAELP